jgi:hypothetical protein
MTFPSRTNGSKKLRVSRFSIFGHILLLFSSFVLGVNLASAAEITLAWDANSEPNLMGYNIYYDTSPGPPYLGTDADQGVSPIMVWVEDLEDPGNPFFTITGLDDEEVYYFSVTAFDMEHQESAFSNEASTAGATVSDPDYNLSFDGSEGCFIGVARYSEHAGEGISLLILLLLSGIMHPGVLWVWVNCTALRTDKVSLEPRRRAGHSTTHPINSSTTVQTFASERPPSGHGSPNYSGSILTDSSHTRS